MLKVVPLLFIVALFLLLGRSSSRSSLLSRLLLLLLVLVLGRVANRLLENLEDLLVGNLLVTLDL